MLPGRDGQQPQRRPRLGPVPALLRRRRALGGRIGVLAALYPAVWGLGQLVTGGLSDRIGRKWLIAGGMFTQAVAIALIAATTGFWIWAVGAVLLGAGTAMVYPTLLAAIGDVAHPPGGPARSASTGSGATAGSPSARSSPGSSPTSLVNAAIYTVAAITASPASSWSSACTRTHPPVPAAGD